MASHYNDSELLEPPPPSYEDAMNDPPAMPDRPTGSSVHDSTPPALPQRPASTQHSRTSSSSYSRPYPTQSIPQHSNNNNRPPPSRPGPSSPPNDDLYTANPNLPFRYPKGYFCQKCKNHGFKKTNKVCLTCWSKFYLNKHAYNPNPNLNFRYPTRYFCEKCNNTGIKQKNGKTCKDCYDRFAPRNAVPTISNYSSYDPFDIFGSSSTTTTTMYYPNGPSGPGPGGPPGPPPGPPLRVYPGDPRIGGQLCGRCRGSGVTHFFLDEELCRVCGGVGRILQGGPSPGPRPY